MTNYAYSTKTLGAGTIGGRGFWLVKEARFPFSNAPGLHGNHNLRLERTLADALVFNERLPHIGNPLSKLEILKHTPDAISALYTWVWQYYRFNNPPGTPDYPVWIKFEDNIGGSYWGFSDHVSTLDNPYQQRHVHRVLYDNQQGNFIESAERIQIGESGYTDTLPGLFAIKPVSGTIVSGDYCYVTITPHPNPRVWWGIADARVHYDYEADFGTVNHPYIRGTAEMVRVDLSIGNSNKHLIPGVAIEFATTPIDGDYAIVSIGYEYVNAYSETGELGSIVGAKAYFMPMASRSVQPHGYQAGLYGLSDEYSFRPYYMMESYTPSAPYSPGHWSIYNVTGEAQEGCKFIIRPLIRLDQGNNLHPFDQWFMGCNFETTLTPGDTPWTISFSNYAAGSPATVKLNFSGSISTTIKEINSTTYVPTGVEHTSGTGLKCDGTTLYRWDALGIYFVLSEDLVVSDTAEVHIRRGCAFEKRIISTALYESWNVQTPPFEHVIGGWDSYYDAVNDLYYPASFGVRDESDVVKTGIIQTQGYDYEFSNSSIDPVNTHWYNHYWKVPTWFTSAGSGDSSNMGEYCVMVVCNDPRYFQVVPMNFNWSNRARGRAVYLEEGLVGFMPNLKAQVSSPLDEMSLSCSGSIHESEGKLILRVNQISPELIALLADSGITLE